MKFLNANGADIPALGLGTWDLRGEECEQIVCSALKKGYSHIDTAIMYANETQVGEGIRQSGVGREDVFLTTKVWPDEIADGLFERAVEGSLRRLGTDYIDLLLIHWPPKTMDVRLWAGLLNGAVERGWARNVGVSNFTVKLLDDIVAVSDQPIACNQVEYHPYLDQDKVLGACRRHGVAFMSYRPIHGGSALFDESVVRSAAQAHHRTSAQIVLRWHMQQEGVGAIPKTANHARLDANIDIFDFELSNEEMAAISALSLRNDRTCNFDFSPQWDTP